MERYDDYGERMTMTEYQRGYIAGLREYAWWKDGEQLVGTCGTTLKRAVEEFLGDKHE